MQDFTGWLVGGGSLKVHKLPLPEFPRSRTESLCEPMVKNRWQRNGAAVGVTLSSRNFPDSVAEKENAAWEGTGPLIEMVETEPVPELVWPCDVRRVAQRFQKILVERGENRTVIALWPEEGFLQDYRQIASGRAPRFWIFHNLFTECEDLIFVAA
jgi:hypothetical protein